MKKLLLLILCATTMMISACSKDDHTQKDQAVAQADEKNNNKNSSDSTSEQKEEDATETAINDSEEDSSNSEEDKENAVNGNEDKEYLTNNHQFIASDITNLTEKEVSKIWGEPLRSEEKKFRFSGTSDFVPAVVNYYQNEKYAVTFVKGKAASLVYTIDEEIPFDDEKTKALELAGLPTDVEETSDTDTAFVWNNIGGVYEVKMFSKAGLVDYLYITLDESYK